MKATGGKANPGVVNEIVARKLGWRLTKPRDRLLDRGRPHAKRQGGSGQAAMPV